MMGASAGQIILAGLLGVALGAWFFGGLLWTVRRLSSARNPMLLMSISLLVRAVVVIAVMVWLAREHWLLPAIALLGFIAFRQWSLVKWAKVQPQQSTE